MAVSSCCDSDFVGQGGSAGAYALTLSAPPDPVGSISGEIVDAVTGSPLPGDQPPFASAELRRCDQFDDCSETVSAQPADSQGRFLFFEDFSGSALPEGRYRVVAFADSYDPSETEPFDAAGGQDIDTGRILLQPPPPPIGSISGRVVDAVTEMPLSGEQFPFPFVQLLRCDEFGDCSETANAQAADSQGVFLFRTDFQGQPLRPGLYQVLADAIDYDPNQSEPFSVQSAEHFDLGQFPLQPPPIVFSDLVACDNIPGEGGACTYRVQINNNTLDEIRGTAWSIVTSEGIEPPMGFSTFEVKKRRKVHIPALSGQEVEFGFEVPADVTDGTRIWVSIYLGENPDPDFRTLDSKVLFQIEKVGAVLRTVTEEEAGAQFHRRLRQRIRLQSRSRGLETKNLDQKSD